MRVHLRRRGDIAVVWAQGEPTKLGKLFRVPHAVGERGREQNILLGMFTIDEHDAAVAEQERITANKQGGKSQ